MGFSIVSLFILITVSAPNIKSFLKIFEILIALFSELNFEISKEDMSFIFFS